MSDLAKLTRTSIALSDVDLARLVVSEDADVRAQAEAAADRLAAQNRWDSVPAHVAALIADVLREARTQGRLIYRGELISQCRYCGERSTWKKPKRRRTEVEHKIHGRELAHRFVHVTGHISVGGCSACVERALPVLRAELARFPVELPLALRSDGAPVFKRWDRVRCRKCDWSGHEGQLGKLRTLMNDGDYPGRCPSCGAERRFLGADPFERADGFDVVETGEKSNG